MAAPVDIISVGSHVWVEDVIEKGKKNVRVEDSSWAWIEGEVLSIDGQNIYIKTTNGKEVIADVSKVLIKDAEAPLRGVDDMTKLSYLHEPGVLQNLATRYELDEIYTYTGSILIAINPFKKLPHLYDTQMMEQYKGAALGEMSPHAFAIADVAFRAMMNEGKSNSIIVSGQSGAGKTETTKFLMRYLAYLGGRSGIEGRTVEQKVLESNQLLEAFGNAKTVLNNNSSRFGKYVEIQFDKGGKISGATVKTYLLERSRVCQVSDPERNYHCFYLLCAAPPEDIANYELGNPESFHYLNQSNCYQRDEVNDTAEYLATKSEMDIVGISEQEQEAIFRVLAAILHLGNIDFANGKETDSSIIKDDKKSRFHLNMAAELLMCDAQGLEDALIKHRMVVRKEVTKKNLNPVAAVSSRDGLAKTIYCRLFDWLVDRINISIGQDPNSKSVIGVLDINGFENSKCNSFEQFCINYTDEKLHRHFNEHVFKSEQEDYTKEGIDWSYIEFADNEKVLDLIEKNPGGIIATLDEACMFPRATHETFAQKLYSTFQNNPCFSKPKLSRTDFTITHYAGDVTYQADQFLEKNKDYVVVEHQELLTASKCPFVAGLFPLLPEESSKSSKSPSVGKRFKENLKSLMDTLNATEPHYIRCLKPNNDLKPAFFDNKIIINQLRCAGVLETIKISIAGYPSRPTFLDFRKRFGILAPEVLEGNYDDKVACQMILNKTELKGYQIGKTKVLLRAGQMAKLYTLRTEIINPMVRIIQRKFLSHILRKQFVTLRKAAIHLQSHLRGILVRKLYEHLRREAAAVKIQKIFRGYVARKSYIALQMFAITFRKQTKAAIIIQAHWRCYREFSDLTWLQNALLVYQCGWRRRVARKELRKLKMAATETEALKEMKDKLEKKVEELEKRLRTDLEAKAQEISKLQDALHAAQLQAEEANARVIREQETGQKAIEEALPVMKEAPFVVQDTAKIDAVTAEVENGKVCQLNPSV